MLRFDFFFLEVMFLNTKWEEKDIFSGNIWDNLLMLNYLEFTQ